MGVRLDEERPGEDQYVYLFGGVAEQRQPDFSWYLGAVRIGGNQLEVLRNRRSLRRGRPQKLFFNTKVVRDAVTMFRVWHPAAKPSSDCLRVNLARFGQRLGPDATLEQHAL
ncbi:hypothetical protein GCM10009764_26430 [Nocardia ninae]|uniref:Uncharacterized protein n=1 Tax=Nocardia ninae NBRC 108245 TaxID=1210091 RepID=A0A511MDD2_9NOCA|nr:hypothetical protein NN4_26270 [Nocardia ninae NBRC 108245]